MRRSPSLLVGVKRRVAEKSQFGRDATVRTACVVVLGVGTPSVIEEVA